MNTALNENLWLAHRNASQYAAEMRTAKTAQERRFARERYEFWIKRIDAIKSK